MFFSPKFDIKRKSKHLFFVCFQEQLLKLKYSIELRKSKILSTLIFHIASFFKEKNNACRRESCFFYRNHLLEQKSAFLRRRNMNFFRQEFRIALWPNDVVSVGTKASLRTFEDFRNCFEKSQTWIFVKKWSDARADDIFCFSQNSKFF